MFSITLFTLFPLFRRKPMQLNFQPFPSPHLPEPSPPQAIKEHLVMKNNDFVNEASGK
jgi:hypothetical protein